MSVTTAIGMDEPRSVVHAAAVMRAQRYTPEHKPEWDDLIRSSRNGTFLFFRDYMDYMGDRVGDCSLIIRDHRDRVVAVLPGHIEGDTYLSHGRLTYGGLVTGRSVRLPGLLYAFDACMDWLAGARIRRLIYKTVPHIYHRAPAEDDRYALFLLGARWIRSGMLAVVSRTHPIDYQERRRRAIRRANNRGLAVRLSTDYAQYWRILQDVLQERYGTQPVHSLAEIENLHRQFPANVQLYACFDGPAMLAGIVVYYSGQVLRAQYIASSEEGRRIGALDLLIDILIREVHLDAAYVDLGTSDERNGALLNTGLMEQKEGFGGRAVALDQYEIDVTAWQPGGLISALR